jgi:hypothetical protein
MSRGHKDKFRVGFSNIPQEDWERIFGKGKYDRIEVKRDPKKARVRRDSDDFMNKPTPWV